MHKRFMQESRSLFFVGYTLPYIAGQPKDIRHYIQGTHAAHSSGYLFSSPGRSLHPGSLRLTPGHVNAQPVVCRSTEVHVTACRRRLTEASPSWWEEPQAILACLT